VALEDLKDFIGVVLRIMKDYKQDAVYLCPCWSRRVAFKPILKPEEI